jgi:hypothetical protein
MILPGFKQDHNVNQAGKAFYQKGDVLLIVLLPIVGYIATVPGRNAQLPDKGFDGGDVFLSDTGKIQAVDDDGIGLESAFDNQCPQAF